MTASQEREDRMYTAARWLALVIVIALVLSIIGLAGYARGPEHHRGDEVGTHGTTLPTDTAP